MARSRTWGWSLLLLVPMAASCRVVWGIDDPRDFPAELGGAAGSSGGQRPTTASGGANDPAGGTLGRAGDSTSAGAGEAAGAGDAGVGGQLSDAGGPARGGHAGSPSELDGGAHTAGGQGGAFAGEGPGGGPAVGGENAQGGNPGENRDCTVLSDDFNDLSNTSWSTSHNGGAGVSARDGALVLQTTPNIGEGTAQAHGTQAFSIQAGTIIFQTRLRTYVDQSVYGDHQPRGLAAGADRSNALEFITSSPTPARVTCRSVANGLATETQVQLGATVNENHLYKIVATPARVDFYVDNALVATHTTNIPSAPLNAYYSTSDGGYGEVAQEIDYVSLAHCAGGVPDAKRVFLTAAAIPADFGGSGAANATCQLEAESAGLGGIYRAWLDDGASANLPLVQFFRSPVGYALVNQVYVAKSFDDLIDGELAAPINVQADGTQRSLAQAWTNVHLSGAYPGWASCDAWSATGTSVYGWTGQADATGREWLESQILPCLSTRHASFYCFEQ